MHDIRLIRDDPAAFDAAMARRGVVSPSAAILELDTERRANATAMQEGQARRNELSRKFGELKRTGATQPSDLVAELESLKRNLPQGEVAERDVSAKLMDALVTLPNRPAPDVPDGEDEAGNVEVLRWGTPRVFDFTPREHADHGPALGMDFETGVLISGARFTFLRGQMARLHRALGQFMLDKQSGENGYTECNPPLMVKDEATFGTGQLPKFKDDLFATYVKPDFADYYRQKWQDYHADTFNIDNQVRLKQLIEATFLLLPKEADRRWLIPTAEVSLTNSVREQILPQSALPMRLTALTPCFRAEAGAAGRDTRGFIRQHQFEKVEMVSICTPEQSDAEHERMTLCAEGILQALDLPYRKMLLCAGDMGFTARKTYDLEVWLPGQHAYREISSCSNCGDFQARRMNARYRTEGGPEGKKGGTEFVHTLNGSGLAVGRTLVAVLENYQQADGAVDVPHVLLPYMGGLTRLVPASA